MLRAIVIIVILAAGGGAVYYLVKSKGDVKEAIQDAKKDAGELKKEAGEVVDKAEGYGEAKTPKEAADLFTKAIKNRKYDTAAKYCTAKYGEELKKGDKAASALGESLDKLRGQMESRGVMNDEMKMVLFLFDPFPKNVSVIVSNETDKDAIATFSPELPKLTGAQLTPTAKWDIDGTFWGALYANLYERQPGPNLRVKIVKEGDIWKLDFPANAELQRSVNRLNDRYKYYSQMIDKLSLELKNDPVTQEDFKGRLRNLFEEAKKSSN